MAPQQSQAPGAKSGNKKPVELTALAKKYGHRQHRILKGTGKSGLTPLSPFRPASVPKSPGRVRKENLHFYQKRQSHGFSMAELKLLEATPGLEEAELKSNLNNPIDPIFGRSRWLTLDQLGKHEALIPIMEEHEGEGFWSVENDRIWALLQPSLQFASKALSNADLWAWYDALFEGDRRPISENRIPPGYDRKIWDLFSFHQRPVQDRSDPRPRLKELFKNIKFRIYSGSFCPFSGKRDITTGITFPSCLNTDVYVQISLEQLQPLLRNDISDAERLITIQQISTTFVHEFGHALWEVIGKKMVEPYFEDEVIRECGFSLEDKLWCILTQFPFGQRGSPLGWLIMGGFLTNWCSQKHEKWAIDELVLLNLSSDQIDRWFNYDFWPIPSRWFHSVVQEDTWIKARQFGTAALKCGPLTVGTRFNSQKLFYNFMNEAVPKTLGIINDGMTAAEKFHEISETTREAHISRVQEALNLSWNNQPQGLFGTSFQLNKDDRQKYDVPTDEESTDEAEKSVLQCERWTEITAYLFQNRAPEELALDTMTFDIREAILYRYIMDRGGLSITPREFRNFLMFADEREELFEFELDAYSSGMVTRIDAGWPPAQQYTIIKPNRVDQAYENQLHNFKTILGDLDPDQTNIAVHYETFRDIDFEALRFWVNEKTDYYADETSREFLEDIIHACAADGHRITLGPKGIARFLAPGSSSSSSSSSNSGPNQGSIAYTSDISDEEV